MLFPLDLFNFPMAPIEYRSLGIPCIYAVILELGKAHEEFKKCHYGVIEHLLAEIKKRGWHDSRSTFLREKLGGGACSRVSKKAEGNFGIFY